MKIDFSNLFSDLNEMSLFKLKMVDSKTIIRVFFGLNSEGKKRVSFLTQSAFPKLQDTNMLRVSQGWESENVFWTNVDLIDNGASEIFYNFCSDLVNSMRDTKTEKEAGIRIKNRYHIWIKMFNRSPKKLSEEMYKGLFGELYVMKHYLEKKIGTKSAIEAWVGPLKLDKDFSYNSTYLEVKTTNVKSPTITISSLNQLSFPPEGELAVLKVEDMSNVYEDSASNLSKLINSIQESINDAELLDLFFSKLKKYGLDTLLIEEEHKFLVKDLTIYKVDNLFPILKTEDIAHPEIINITYQIILKSIEKHKVHYDN